MVRMTYPNARLQSIAFPAYARCSQAALKSSGLRPHKAGVTFLENSAALLFTGKAPEKESSKYIQL